MGHNLHVKSYEQNGKMMTREESLNDKTLGYETLVMRSMILKLDIHKME